MREQFCSLMSDEMMSVNGGCYRKEVYTVTGSTLVGDHTHIGVFDAPATGVVALGTSLMFLNNEKMIIRADDVRD